MSDNSKPFHHVLTAGWTVQSAMNTLGDGDVISTAGFGDGADWHPASVPATALAVLVQDGVYPDPYFGKNILDIPTEQFTCGWWYRKEFPLAAEPGRFASVVLDGVNQRADVWLNGSKIADRETIAGPFRRFVIPITEHLHADGNVLAIQVFPPRPEDFSIGFVDWNYEPPDRNMGIWRPVSLRCTGAVRLDDAWVRSDLQMPSMDRADLTVGVTAVNLSENEVDGELCVEIDGILVSRSITLSAGERREIVLQSQDAPELSLQQPRIWWPHNLGTPELYRMRLGFTIAGETSDEQEVDFGVRHITDWINEDGMRGFQVNGQPVLMRGAGWCDDLLLADTPERVEAQIQYACHANLNCLRFEGFWGNSRLVYELCDRYGIVYIAGWSCQWEWTSRMRGARRDDWSVVMPSADEDIICESFADQVRWMRNGAGLAGWMIGSDRVPPEDFERRHRALLEDLDPGRPVVTCIGTKPSEVSGPSYNPGSGPYQYVPPVFWYNEKAKGFNWECCPGAALPPIESLRRMLPAEHLWPIDDGWDLHCATGKFGTLDIYRDALKGRYYNRELLEDFLQFAHVMDYELMRGMFEAFGCGKHRATGLIQWMFNSAWPNVYWQLFDHYLQPNASFYASRKANAPLHLAYHYADHAVWVINDHFHPVESLEAEIQLLDFHAAPVHRRQVSFTAAANASACIVDLPKLSEDGDRNIFFLDLRLRDADGRPIDTNFYWLSPKPDCVAKKGHDLQTGWDYHPEEYANFHDLRYLAPALLETHGDVRRLGDEIEVGIVLASRGESVAFQVEAAVLGNRTAQPILPVFWNDNHVSLLPGERRALTARFAARLLEEQAVMLQLRGINVASQRMLLPTAHAHAD
jgi:exo-1,4-beta-D-glucosaminidase